MVALCGAVAEVLTTMPEEPSSLTELISAIKSRVGIERQSLLLLLLLRLLLLLSASSR